MLKTTQEDANELCAPRFMQSLGQSDSSGSKGASHPARPIRVCFLIERLMRGGTELQLLALIKHLNRSIVIPYLCLLDGEDEVSRSLEPEDCRVMRLGVTKLRRLSSLTKLRALGRFLRSEKIDILQPYLPDSTYFGAMAGWLAAVPCVVRTRNNSNHWMTPTHRLMGRLLNPIFSLTVCNSQAARDAVLADERPDPRSVVVIENGVDLERFDHTPPLSLEHDGTKPRRVGMVANLRPVKGVDILIEAAAIVIKALPDVVFQVAGEGAQRPELEQLIAKHDLRDRFQLIGKVSDIPAFLGSLDLAVLSSRAEGMPNAVLEYMAAGRPVVAARVGGVPQILSHDEGVLVRPGSSESLAAGISLLLENPQHAAHLAQSARARVSRDFGRQLCVKRFEALYSEQHAKHARRKD